MYFIQQPVRVRQFEIGGIMKVMFQNLMIFCFGDIRHIQKLNNGQNDAGL